MLRFFPGKIHDRCYLVQILFIFPGIFFGTILVRRGVRQVLESPRKPV